MNALRSAVCVLLLLSSAACDGDTPTRETERTRAQLTLTVAERDWFPNPNPGRRYWLTARITIRETAGVGANLDFLRLEGRGPGGSYERAEIGSGDIVSEVGTNRIQARATWSYTVAWEWNMQNALGFQVTAQVTDDHGNVTMLVSRDQGYPE